MAKTGKQIQGDIRRMLAGSKLAEAVSGGVYRNGYRPRDSRKEDIIVTFTTGIPDQIETGVVTVNIYVPDIDPCGNGVFVEDGRRTEQLEALAQQWADSLTAAVTATLPSHICVRCHHDRGFSTSTTCAVLAVSECDVSRLTAVATLTVSCTSRMRSRHRHTSRTTESPLITTAMLSRRTMMSARRLAVSMRTVYALHRYVYATAARGQQQEYCQ